MSHIIPNIGRWCLPPSAPPAPVQLTSAIRRGSKAPFPEFSGERIYMQPFVKVGSEILLPTHMARWVPTVAAMLDGIETSARMFLMVDQSEVEAGQAHRRPGAHLDGNWTDGDGPERSFDPSELLILASDVAGCVAYLGNYPQSRVKAGGDCSAVDLESMKRVRLLAGYAYIGTVATIHESVPVKQACKRTLVRINAGK